MNAEVMNFIEEDRHAVLATNGRSGLPQLTPVWYLFEDGVLYVSAQVTTVKVRNLRRDPGGLRLYRRWARRRTLRRLRRPGGTDRAG